MVAVQASPEELRARLQADWPFFAPRCHRIVNDRGDVIAFTPKPVQMKLWEGIEAQRLAGLPQRAIILKARQLGFSTMAQSLIEWRATTRANHRALVIAQDTDTAGSLFDMGKRMWAMTPDKLGLKPPIVSESNTKGSKFILWGEPARMLRRDGQLGLNSQLTIGTAKEVEAGRGLTIHSLHLSEVAFYRDIRKLLAILNAVPDHPDTLVLKESTADGLNHFKDDWDAAEAGQSAYVPIFAAWHEDAEKNWLPFANEQERETLRAELGTGPWGEEEPGLVDEYGLELEQLNWRRYTIVNKCGSDLAKFHQEHPSTPQQAFLTTGKQVFSITFLNLALKATDVSDPRFPTPENPGPRVGVLEGQLHRTIKGRQGATFEVPAAAAFKPVEYGRAPWKVWELPETGLDEHGRQRRDDETGEKIAAGQYVVAVDAMGGEDVDTARAAHHAIEVIDHRTLAQVAEYVSQEDPDELAEQVLLAALLFNTAWVAVEVTGGWGGPIVRKVSIDWRYAKVYARKKLDERLEPQQDRLGWDTNPQTKPLMHATAKELFRTGTHGIRSAALVREAFTYVELGRGKTGPEPGKASDRLMAWMVGQQVAQIKPVIDTLRRRGPVDTRTGGYAAVRTRS
jgi:hypothetical protein